MELSFSVFFFFFFCVCVCVGFKGVLAKFLTSFLIRVHMDWIIRLL